MEKYVEDRLGIARRRTELLEVLSRTTSNKQRHAKRSKCVEEGTQIRICYAGVQGLGCKWLPDFQLTDASIQTSYLTNSLSSAW